MHYLRNKQGRDMNTAPATKPDPVAKRRWIEVASGSSTDACIDWPWANNGNGYGMVTEKRRNLYVHVLVCERVHGIRPIGAQVAHSCGRPSCCNPRHLRWATPAENCADRTTHGTQAIGERNPGAKLTQEDIETIRSHYIEGRYNQYELAEMFSVHQSCISRVVNGKRWSA
jgi:hypothetical protein